MLVYEIGINVSIENLPPFLRRGGINCTKSRILANRAHSWHCKALTHSVLSREALHNGGILLPTWLSFGLPAGLALACC